MAPASSASVFKRAIGRPIQSGEDEGLARLRVLMKSVCLRRNKRLLGGKLPPKVMMCARAGPGFSCIVGGGACRLYVVYHLYPVDGTR